MNEKKDARSCGDTSGQRDEGNPVGEILVRLKILIAVEFLQIGLLVGLICLRTVTRIGKMGRNLRRERTESR